MRKCTFLAGHFSVDMVRRVVLKNLTRFQVFEEIWTAGRNDVLKVKQVDLETVKATFVLARDLSFFFPKIDDSKFRCG